MSRVDSEADLSQLAEAIRAIASERAMADLLRGLRRSVDASLILERLSRDRDPEIRTFAVDAALPVLGRSNAVTLLQRMVLDRHADVRNGAVAELLAIDPRAIEPYLPRLRRQLQQSEDDPSLIFTLWTLARLNDRESLTTVREIASGFPWAPVRRAAEVVALILEERRREILDRLAGHDHDWTRELAIAAGVMGTDESRAALDMGRAAATDEACQRLIDWAVGEYFRSKDASRP